MKTYVIMPYPKNALFFLLFLCTIITPLSCMTSYCQVHTLKQIATDKMSYLTISADIKGIYKGDGQKIHYSNTSGYIANAKGCQASFKGAVYEDIEYVVSPICNISGPFKNNFTLNVYGSASLSYTSHCNGTLQIEVVKTSNLYKQQEIAQNDYSSDFPQQTKGERNHREKTKISIEHTEK